MNNTSVQVSPEHTLKKYTLLLMCILFDAIGMLSFSLPFIGEFSDVIWAPLSSILLYTMFRGVIGKLGGMISFLEEILPGMDFIPTFTLTWMYQFIVVKNKEK